MPNKISRNKLILYNSLLTKALQKINASFSKTKMARNNKKNITFNTIYKSFILKNIKK